MNTRQVPKRIFDFLTERPGRAYCDDCISLRLGLKWRQQVQLVTSTLAVVPGFQRFKAGCVNCSEDKMLTGTFPNPTEDRKTSRGARPTVLTLKRRAH